MMRVVADTNVFISALMFGGLPGRFLDLALHRRFTLITSKALLDELDEKLRGKFAVSERDAQAIREKLKGIAEVVDPDFELDAVPEDPDDNRVLECAVAGKAEFIVSGDRHLLRLGNYEGIAIVTVRQSIETAGL
ncbi:MAG: putative toxin-antitoxin system toxin component, PIN family [Terracidiphilus sp.]|jgi:putative PIN family toxin of toxin-antitoxin system